MYMYMYVCMCVCVCLCVCVYMYVCPTKQLCVGRTTYNYVYVVTDIEVIMREFEGVDGDGVVRG